MTARETPDAPEVSRRARAWTLVALGLATLASFAGLAQAGWILFDDPVYVFNNPHVARGLTLEGLRWMFSHAHGGNFHPLTTIAHMLDVEVFGLDPRGPHLVNLALHVANALLVCVVLARYTGAWWRSAIVAALFALHPLRVESVAWISERKDVLCTLFFLLALDAYRRWTIDPRRGAYARLVAWFVFGLLAKPMLVTLPFVLLLLDAWPLARTEWRLRGARWREKLPLFAIALASAIITFLVQRAAGAVKSSESLPLGARIANALAGYARYLGKTFVPVDLAVYYPNAGSVSVALACAAATLIVAATACAWILRERRPWLLFGWLWYLGTLVPVIGIVQVGDQALADRYTYIPSMGVMVALVWEIAATLRRARLLVRAAIGATALVLVASSIATARQVALWKDSRTLFAHAVRVTEPNALAHQVLGNALITDGELDHGIAELEIALALSPDFPDAHNNLGSALGVKGRFDEAIVHFQAALARQNTPETHHNLAFALTQTGRRDEAMHEYEAALALDPDLAGAHAKLGALLTAAGRLDEAAAHLQRALELSPDEIETLRSMAITRTLQGRVEDAVRSYRALLARAPKDLDALNNIAWIRATHADAAHRDGAEAVRLAETARDAAPEANDVLYSTLAAAYAESGRFADAVKAGERAVELARAAHRDADAQRFAAQLDGYAHGRAFHFEP
jgi:tetratricopeptide (TPR) repeat protein